MKESSDIKNIQPAINKAQKTRWYNYAIVLDKDKSGYNKYKVVKADTADKPLSYYGSRRTAQQHIQQIGDAFHCVIRLMGLTNPIRLVSIMGLENARGHVLVMNFQIATMKDSMTAHYLLIDYLMKTSS